MHVLHDWLLTAERVAVHLPSRTAVVADLHLGYAEARRRRGEAVPDESVAEQLLPLLRVLQRQHIRRLVVAGDLLEDSQCHDALAQFKQWLHGNAIQRGVLVPGNHDLSHCGLRIADCGLQIRKEGALLGEWRVLHGDADLPDGPAVHGHEHPCLRLPATRKAIRPRGRGDRIAPCRVEGHCYLVGPQRLILPAYSEEAAGVNILSARRWRSYRCYVVAEDRVLDLGLAATLRSRLSAALRAGPTAD